MTGRDKDIDNLDRYAERLLAHPDLREEPWSPRKDTEGNPDLTARGALPHGDATRVQDLARAMAGHTKFAEVQRSFDALDENHGLEPGRPVPSASTRRAADQWWSRQEAAQAALPRTETLRVPPQVAARLDNLTRSTPLGRTRAELREMGEEAADEVKRDQDAEALCDLARIASDGVDDREVGDDWVDVPLRRDDVRHLSIAHRAGETNGRPAYTPDDLQGSPAWLAESRRTAEAADLYTRDPGAYAASVRAMEAAGAAEPVELAAVRDLTGETEGAYDRARDSATGWAFDQELRDRVDGLDGAYGPVLAPRAGKERYHTISDVAEDVRPAADALLDGDVCRAAEILEDRYPDYEGDLEEWVADLKSGKSDPGAVLDTLAADCAETVPVDDPFRGRNALAEERRPDGTPLRTESLSMMDDVARRAVSENWGDVDATCERLGEDYPPVAADPATREMLTEAYSRGQTGRAEDNLVDRLREHSDGVLADPTPGAGEPGYGRIRENGSHLFRQNPDGTWSARSKTAARGRWAPVEADLATGPATALIAPSAAAGYLGGHCMACGRSLKNTPASGFGPTCARKYA
jgi:hypothetical protein